MGISISYIAGDPDAEPFSLQVHVYENNPSNSLFPAEETLLGYERFDGLRRGVISNTYLEFSSPIHAHGDFTRAPEDLWFSFRVGDEHGPQYGVDLIIPDLLRATWLGWSENLMLIDFDEDGYPETRVRAFGQYETASLWLKVHTVDPRIPAPASVALLALAAIAVNHRRR